MFSFLTKCRDDATYYGENRLCYINCVVEPRTVAGCLCTFLGKQNSITSGYRLNDCSTLQLCIDDTLFGSLDMSRRPLPGFRLPDRYAIHGVSINDSQLRVQYSIWGSVLKTNYRWIYLMHMCRGICVHIHLEAITIDELCKYANR